MISHVINLNYNLKKIKMKNIPNKIYLQIGEKTPKDADFEELNEVTWCQDRINDNDIEYVRIDKNKKNEKTN